MAHTNSTTNYNLPQFVSTDKPAWLTDVNTAYSDIDTGMHNAQVAADNAQADATQALTDSGTAMTTAASADAKGSGSIASIASTFDTTSTYNVGDVVIYNNLLYICSVAIVNPGPWSGSANWERVTIDTLINNLDTEINTTIDGIEAEITELSTKPTAFESVRYGAQFVATGFADTTTRILLYVSYPFLMSNTNYNVSCSRVNIPGTGVIQSGITIDTKYNTGCLIIVNTNATVGRAYGGVADLSFT